MGCVATLANLSSSLLYGKQEMRQLENELGVCLGGRSGKVFAHHRGGWRFDSIAMHLTLSSGCTSTIGVEVE